MTAATGQSSRLRRNREFRLLWIGQALSDFGSGMTVVVLPLALLAAGVSTAAVGTLGSATLLVGLLARVPAGYLADRLDLRRILLAADLTRVVAVAAVATYALVESLSIAVALALVVVTQVALEGFQPAQNKFVRRVVPGEQMVAAMSVNQARSYAADIAAPAVAVLLLAAGPALPLGINAVTFAISALCVWRLARRPQDHAEPVVRRRLLVEVSAGWVHLSRDRLLRRIVAYGALVNLMFTTLTAVLVLGVGRESGGAPIVAAGLTTAAVAGLAGSLLAPWVSRHFSLRAVLVSGPSLAAVVLAFAAWWGGVLAVVVAFAVLCLLAPMAGAMLAGFMARVVPDDVFGRVSTAGSFVAQILQPCGPLAAGLLLVDLSLPSAAGVLAVAFTGLAVLALGVHTAQRPTRSEAAES